jgi:hypothetical protein
MAETNPNGANGTTSDPREQIMWDIYVENLSKGIDNAYEASMKAGYTVSSAKNITLTGWFKERKAKLRRKEMLSKSEMVLNDTLDMDTTNKEGAIDPQLHKIKVDVAKTLVTTLGKDDGYSTRSELTGKNGEEFTVKSIVINKTNAGNH